jgi:hypothetical protein
VIDAAMFQMYELELRERKKSQFKSPIIKLLGFIFKHIPVYR